MHENVRVGRAGCRRRVARLWLERAAAILTALGLEVDVVPANDPFFGRAGRILAVGSARPGAEDGDRGRRSRASRPTAIVSSTATSTTSAPTSASATSDGGVAHTRLHRLRSRARHAGALAPARPATSRRGPRRVRRRLDLEELTVHALLGLDPATYRSHALHEPDRHVPGDQLLHRPLDRARCTRSGHEPLAMLGYCTAVDFEGDQWTFFKPPPADLDAPLRHGGLRARAVPAARRALRRRSSSSDAPVIVEVDSLFLPDTAGRSYRAHAREDHRSSSRRSTSSAGGCATSTTPATTSSTATTTRCAAPGRAALRPTLPPYVEIVRLDRLEPCAPERPSRRSRASC